MSTLDAIVGHPIISFQPSKSGGATPLPAPMVVLPMSLLPRQNLLMECCRGSTSDVVS